MMTPFGMRSRSALGGRDFLTSHRALRQRAPSACKSLRCQQLRPYPK
ncbi:hypothetical protein NY08_4146 [Rhodococcus sp. B7740]|nr:hypothetical protein NY08_4146 [Rhodococcus sp. B7740]